MLNRVGFPCLGHNQSTIITSNPIPQDQTIIFIGDSTTYGEGSADTERQGSFVEKIKALMVADGYAVNTDNFIGFGRTSSTFPNAVGDDRITYTSSFSANTVGRAIGSLINSSGGTISFTPDEDVDTFDVFMATGVGTDVILDIDGGTADTYDVSSGGNDFQKFTITAASVGTHTLNIELDGFLCGVLASDSTQDKIQLINVGVQSSRTTDWAYVSGQPWTMGQTWNDYGIDTFIISLGINDGFNSVSATDLETNLETLIDGIYAQNADAKIILVDPNPYNESAVEQYNYIAKYAAIATAYSIPLVDVRTAFGGNVATATSNGYMSDDRHPNDAGYEVYADLIYDALVEVYGGATAEPPSEFLPTDLSGLLVWLDAADTSTITESGGAVSQWDDKSGNGYHATQGTGSLQPETGTRTQNGNNVLDFDGADNLEISNDLGLAGARTIIGVGFVDSSPDSYSMFASSDFSPTRYYFGADRVRFGDAADIGLTGTRTGQLVINVVTISGNSATADLNLYLENGNSYNTTTDYTADADNMFIGQYEATGSSGFDGKYGEFIQYSRVLTTTEINNLCNALADKWGTTWSDL